MEKARSDSDGLRNPHTSVQVLGIDPGPQNGVGLGGVVNAESAKASSMALMLFLFAATACSSVEITSNQVHMFVKHHSANCKDELFPNTTFLLVKCY